MNCRVIARDSHSFIGRKCPICHRVARPGHTVVCDQNSRWIAHRNCLADFIIQTYAVYPKDGAAVKRSTREEREQRAKQRDEQRFTEYRERLLQRLRITE